MIEITSNIIQKYSKYSTPQLRIKAGNAFRKFIRERDKGEKCISCDSYNTSDASHFYSAGKYPALEFDPDNCHLACRKCNYFLSGNLLEYRKRLIERIGQEKVARLDYLAAQYKRIGYKHDRLKLIEVILKYKSCTTT
jgi:hypothetical protein